MEIERKYLIKEMPAGLDQCIRREIEQGYLCRKPVLRIRGQVEIDPTNKEAQPEKSFLFTYKGKGDKHAGLIINDEVERVLPEEAFNSLKTKIEGHLIHKTRYLVPLGRFDNETHEPTEGRAAGTYRLLGELDVFHGELEGLCFCEVEFPSVEAAQAFKLPDWLGDNVSDDKRYSNSRLSQADSVQDLFACI